MITASIDKKTSMTTVSVIMQNPKVAALVADSVVKKLQEYIIAVSYTHLDVYKRQVPFYVGARRYYRL